MGQPVGSRARGRRAGGPIAGLVVALLVALTGSACGSGSEEASAPGEVTVTVTVTPDPTVTRPAEPSSGPTTSAPATTARPTPAPAPSPTTAAPPAPPAPPVTQACLGPDLELLPTQERVVALTIDLGGDDAGLGPILATLAERDVRATFFVTGDWARRYPEGLRRVVAAGHVVGNHTDTHPHLTQLSDTQVRAQIESAETEVVRITGHNPRPLFRFPFGERDERTIGIVGSQGYCAYRWTVDTLGWKGTSGGITAATVRDRVLASLQPGEIVLMHAGANPDDGSTLDADALPALVDQLRARGYGFTTLPTGRSG
jgi:peptidoglycan-N-acetylglucosamine deacetylase